MTTTIGDIARQIRDEHGLDYEEALTLATTYAAQCDVPGAIEGSQAPAIEVDDEDAEFIRESARRGAEYDTSGDPTPEQIRAAGEQSEAQLQAAAQAWQAWADHLAAQELPLLPPADYLDRTGLRVDVGLGLPASLDHAALTDRLRALVADADAIAAAYRRAVEQVRREYLHAAGQSPNRMEG